MKAISLFFTLLIALAGTSCITSKKCLQRFPPSRDTLRIEKIRDSIIYKDKLVEVKIPGATKIDSIPIPCPPPPLTYIPDTARAETEYAKGMAWFDYPNIQLKLIQKQSILQVRLDSAIKESYHWKTEYEKITNTPAPVVTKYIPGFYKVAFWLWIGVIIAIIGFIIIKYGRKFISL
jgi:hypothetical protein